jgi:hypothetical protein
MIVSVNMPHLDSTEIQFGRIVVRRCFEVIITFTLGLVLSLTSPAYGQVVSSNVEMNDAGVLSSDPQGPSTSAEVSSFLETSNAFTVDFSANGFGRAVQRVDGVGAVRADAIFANGQTPNLVRATTQWSESVTNTTSDPIVYEFEYVITPPALRIADYAGLPDAADNAPEISFALEIRANGVVLFEAGAVLRGGRNSHTLTESGTSLNPVVTPNPLPSFPTVFGYDFDGRADVLSLGTFGPGETVTVTYTMLAEVLTPGFEAGGRAEVGDPFDLDGTPGFAGGFVGGGVVATETASWGELKHVYEQVQ